MTFTSLRSLLLSVGGCDRAKPGLRVSVLPRPWIAGPSTKRRPSKVRL